MAVLLDQYPKAMLDSGLFQEYSVEAFNQARFINDSCTINVEDVVPQLAPLLKKYDLNDLIGLSRTHQHFQLESNEITETSIRPASACSISVPIDDPERLVMHLKTINLDEFKGISKPIPYMWAFDKNSQKFVAIQYFHGDNQQMVTRLAELGERMEQLGGFLNELVQGLKKFHMEDDLGIFLRYEDLLSWNSEKECLMEDTSTQKRVQIMYPTSIASVKGEKATNLDARVITTQWAFDETAEGVMGCTMISNCHTNNHTS